MRTMTPDSHGDIPMASAHCPLNAIGRALKADIPCLRAVSIYDMTSRYCCRHLDERKHPETFVLTFTNLIRPF